MRLGPLGIPELVIILLVIMMIFGARRLPEIGSSLGKGSRSFNSAITGDDERAEEDNNHSVPITSSNDIR